MKKPTDERSSAEIVLARLLPFTEKHAKVVHPTVAAIRERQKKLNPSAFSDEKITIK